MFCGTHGGPCQNFENLEISWWRWRRRKGTGDGALAFISFRLWLPCKRGSSLECVFHWKNGCICWRTRWEIEKIPYSLRLVDRAARRFPPSPICLYWVDNPPHLSYQVCTSCTVQCLCVCLRQKELVECAKNLCRNLFLCDNKCARTFCFQCMIFAQSQCVCWWLL